MEDPGTKFLVVLSEIKNKKPCWIGKWISLRINSSILLRKSPAWAFWHIISISPNYKNIEDVDIIRYLMAHEYGHVYNYHNVLFILACILVCLIDAIIILYFPWFSMTIKLYFVVLFSIFSIGQIYLEIEFQADRMVALVYSPEIALKGLEWGKQYDRSKDREKRISKMKEYILKLKKKS